MISLTVHQLRIVMAAAEPLPVEKRSLDIAVRTALKDLVQEPAV